MYEATALAITLLSCLLTYLGARRAVRVAQQEADTKGDEATIHDSQVVAQYALEMLQPYRDELKEAHEDREAMRVELRRLRDRIGMLEAELRRHDIEVPPDRRSTE